MHPVHPIDPPAWQAAVDLFRYLDAGHPMRPIPTALRFGDEPVYADMQLTYARYYAMNVVAEQHSVAAAGGLVFIAGAFAANAARNAHKRRQAERQSEAQWREHTPARVVLTGSRTMCQVRGEWLQFPYHVVVELKPDLQYAACVTTFSDVEPMLLSGPASAYYAVLAAYLMYGRERFAGLPGLAPVAAAAQTPVALPSAAPTDQAQGEVISGEIVQ